MLKNLIRTFAAILGAILGYGVCHLVVYVAGRVGIEFAGSISEHQLFIASVATAIIFGIIFFLAAPAIARQGKKVAGELGTDLAGVSAGSIISGAVGLLFGLLAATMLAQLFRIIPNSYVYSVVVVLTYLALCYLGVVVAMTKGKDLVSSLLSPQGKERETRAQFVRRKQGENPKILDTSVIIDGRISEIMSTGFLEGPIVIPEFVLVELRHIADSADSVKRTRGRRGLDILNKIRDDYGVEIYNTDNEKELKAIPEVDVKLLKLAQITGGSVVTNDFNLNKVAGINGVRVLNINELANCLKPVVIPGEDMDVTLIKQGKDPSQAIGYLDDGTMIVVENGKDSIGSTCRIKVTSVLQTSAGRMIFGRLKETEKEKA